MIHIDLLSKLRSGIYLRSYAQVNPLQAYIDEAEQLFDHLQEQIAYQMVTQTMRIQDYKVRLTSKVETERETTELKDIRELLTKLGG
jgi:preprotein translocase subunit SecA